MPHQVASSSRRALPFVVAMLAGCASSGATVRTLGEGAREAQRAEAGAIAADEKAMGGRRARATIAVLPFEPADSAVDELSTGFAELIIADLGKFPELRLLERVRLDDVLREQGLDTSRVDPASAVRVGRIIAAQRLVRGTMASIGDTAVRFEVGLVTVSSSEVTAAYEGQASADGIFAAEAMVVRRLAVALGVTVPSELDARLSERASYASDAFRAFARGARQEAEGELSAAADSYAKASVIAPSFDVASTKSASVKQRAAERGKVPQRRPRRGSRAIRQGGVQSPA